MRTSKFRIGPVAFCLLLSVISAPAVCAQPAESPGSPGTAATSSTPAAASSTPAAVGLEAEAKATLSKLQQAIADADPVKAAEVWADNAMFIDQTGESTTGRAALQARFERVMNQQGKQSLTMRPGSVQLPSPNVALVDGVVQRDADGARVSTSRFSLVLTKSDGKWQIARATETLITGSNAHEHLEQLAWLIGKWTAGQWDAGATVEFAWDTNQNFIQCHTLVHKANKPPEATTQILGWDPRIGKVVSWNFDPQGGFSYGTWTREGNKWIVNLAGIASGGGETRSTDVYTNQDAEHFVWQSTNRFLDGLPVPDTEPITVRRLAVKP